LIGQLEALYKVDRIELMVSNKKGHRAVITAPPITASYLRVIKVIPAEPVRIIRGIPK